MKNRTSLIKRFFVSFLEISEPDHARARKKLAMKLIYIMASSFSVIFGINAWRTGSLPVFIAILGLVASMIFVIVYYMITRNINNSSRILILGVALYFLFLYFTGGSDNSGYLWQYVLPLSALFLEGLVTGTIIALVYFLILVLAVCIPGFPFFSAAYDPATLARFFGSLGAVITLGIIFELVWNKTNSLLKQKNAELEQTVGILENTKGALERSNRELEEFAYIASHDLNEPLRKVKVFSEKLLAEYSDAIGEKGKDYLARMQNANQHMSELLHGLLTYSRVSTSSISFESTDMNIVVKEVLADLEIKIHELAAQVTVTQLPVIMADRLQMRQLMQNLISNALKYHQAGIPPTIFISRNPNPEKNSGRNPNSWQHEIIVRDNGIGFDEKHREKIFELFTRLVGKSEYEGSGIGLTICKKIVERHNGSIAVSSTPGHGSTFMIRL
ncbi:MAG: hypothetical protein JW904_01230 [Spirochaetales bacterium]|nr:hypothetical protein [Spirochaetales bacterium]